MKYTYSAGGIVVNEKGQVAVTSQRGTSWSLPKGHIEPNEDKIEAAKREIWEETGLTDLEFVKDLGSYQRLRIDDPEVMKTIHMFLFKTKSVALKPTDGHNPEARWVDKDEVENLLTAEKDKEFFSTIKNQL